MKIIFQGIKTGAEIWDIIKHPLFKEEDYIKDKLYNFTQYDKVKNGVITATTFPIATESENQESLLENQKQELLNDILKAKAFSGTPEGDADLAELQQQYTDLCNGVPIVCKSELEAQLADANIDRKYLFGMMLEDEGMWG